ncbi:hypothetical protein [Xanthomonas massiliensis]|uniref:hypothetical protein n=1 Tax=Xanthomonas massiliensis TaxID=1720302 RepID=UPI0011C89FFE|nr:hypothetical protein [Xanthomonas massiliensis]
MASSAVDQALKALISEEISRVKLLPDNELTGLGDTGVTFRALVCGKPYDINTWSEPVDGNAAGICAIFVGAWRKLPLGSAKHHFQGFVVATDGSRIDIPEADLWRYD